MKLALKLAERGFLSDSLIRIGIRKLLKNRINEIDSGNCEIHTRRLQSFISDMDESPIACNTQEANDQHYELPPLFFQKVLGDNLKYSSCYYPIGNEPLDKAESAMLELYGERAQLTDNLDILELGCGWGSLTLWMAKNYPESRITAVSNSAPQKIFIDEQCNKLNISNVKVLTADMNEFQTDDHFDRIVSIEMFEHLRNYRRMLNRICQWLRNDGKLFIHIFVHKKNPYLFEIKDDNDWMSKYFFTGGMMPSDDLPHYFQDRFKLDDHWRVSGTHYSKTSRHWLEKLDAHKDEILPIFADTFGKRQSKLWFQRWRIFFMSCEELFGFNNGQEWWVSHYLMTKRESYSKA